MLEAFYFLIIVILIIIFFPLLIYIRWCIQFYHIQHRIIYMPESDFEIISKEKDIVHQEITYQTRDDQIIYAWYVPYSENAEKSNKSAGVESVSVGNLEENRDEEEFDILSEGMDPASHDESRGVILFCHGNTGNISQRIDTFQIFNQLGYSTFIFDYRGYGKSSGKTNEIGTYWDGDGAWNYLINEMGYKPEDIIIFGRSLGGAIASYLAEKYQPRALIIESSFTSAIDMAKMMFPRLPVKWLTRFKYNTLERIKKIYCSVLIVHSPDDRLIPFEHGQKLFEAANWPKKFLRIKGGHLDGFLRVKSTYIQGLGDFLHHFLDSHDHEKN